MKREQNYVARSLPKKPSGSKHIVCHHCGAFGYLRSHCSKFQALKRIKRKEKLELFGNCAMKAKLVLGENGKLLKKVFDVLTSLSMCIFGSHSSNPRLTSHPKQSFRLDEKGFLWLSFYSFGPWFNSFNLCRTLHALDTLLSCICASCISLYALFLFLFFILLLCLCFCVCKNPKTHKKWKIQKV